MLYNRTLLASLRMVHRLASVPIELRAAAVGAGVGAVAWFSPSLVGGGDVLAQQALSGAGTLAIIPLVFVLRLILIACSVAPGTPGGLLAPLLGLGAELGLFFGMLCALYLRGMGLQPEGFAVVGMAALFSAIVRAPLTAIVLVTEVTDNVTMLLPIIVACFAATLIPTLFGDAPILDALRERLPRKNTGTPSIG
jgi:chloride channel protein, CIC family